MLVHDQGTARLDAGVYGKTDVSPDADAYSNDVRCEPASALHDGAEAPVRLPLDSRKHLSESQLHALLAQILVDALSGFLKSRRGENPVSSIH